MTPRIKLPRVRLLSTHNCYFSFAQCCQRFERWFPRTCLFSWAKAGVAAFGWKAPQHLSKPSMTQGHIWSLNFERLADLVPFAVPARSSQALHSMPAWLWMNFLSPFALVGLSIDKTQQMTR